MEPKSECEYNRYEGVEKFGPFKLIPCGIKLQKDHFILSTTKTKLSGRWPFPLAFDLHLAHALSPRQTVQ